MIWDNSALPETEVKLLLVFNDNSRPDYKTDKILVR